MSKAWKAHELATAKHFGGKRRVRINYGESIGDIAHDKYQIECKYGGQCPKLIEVDVPTLVNNKYMMIPSSAHTMYPHMWMNKKAKRVKFIDDCFEQCARYSNKLPILALKRKGMRGFIIVRRWLTEGSH